MRRVSQKLRRKRVEMFEQDMGSFAIMFLTIVYLFIVPSVVAVWVVYNRYVVTGENVERVNIEQRDRANEPLGTRTVDQVSRDGQVIQARGADDQTSRDAQAAQFNQSQLSSIASSEELSRGGENQQQGQRLKQESKTMPSTSRQGNIWTHAPTPTLAERSQTRRQPIDSQASPLNLQPLRVNFGLDQSQNASRDAANEIRVDAVYRGGKVAARKPEVFSESLNIDEWIESLKAYLAGTNPNAATDQVLIAQVKSFLSSTALKRVKHIFKNEACDWSQLK